MFDKPIDELTLSDIEALVDNKVPESQTLDYKLKLCLDKDKDKKEFLADVVSFANTKGGYIIYGVREEGGVPVDIEGFELKDIDKNIKDIDKALLKIEELIENGIEPKIYGMEPEERCKVKAIKLQENKYVFVLRIPKSIYSPHRVKTNGRFVKRGERKKYDMSYDELKAAFLGSEFVNADRELLKKFMETLPSTEGSIPFIKEHNMAGYSFEIARLEDLQKFVGEWDNAEHEFHDEELEKLRKKLLSLSRDYLDELSRNTWLTSPGFAAVPAEWEIEQPERFREVVSKLHQLAEDILNAHQSLIRLGRKKLGL